MDAITAYSFLFGVLLVSQALILYLVLGMRRRVGKEREGLFRESQAKTHSIIYKAIQQANKILVAAELKGLQLLSKQKMTSNDLTDHFNQHLAAVEKALEEQLECNAQHAEETYGEFITSAEKAINDHINQNQKMLEEKAAAMIERTESLITKFTADIEAKVKGDVEKELIAASEEIEQYKQNRMRVVDERIVDILEDVLKVALEKKMSLADQSELIYKALEEAKREHSFGSKAS
jgi:hypothetical protein